MFHQKNKDEFHNIIKKISQKIFIPLTVGGGINNLNDVEKYLKNGADKILLNNLFFKNKKLFNEISRIFGKQFIVACIDYNRENEKYLVYKNKAKDLCNSTFLIDQIEKLYASGAGEIILQSIELDGTGMGIDKKILK